MKIALLGGTGFVGKNVAHVLEENNLPYTNISLSTGTDLRNPESVSSVLELEKPDVIINCAAHVGSLNYVSEQAATVITDNSRMILSLYEAIAKYCPKD